MTIAIFRKKGSLTILRYVLDWFRSQPGVRKTQIGQNGIEQTRIILLLGDSDESVIRSIDHHPLLISSEMIAISKWGVGSVPLSGESPLEAVLSAQKKPVTVISCNNEAIYCLANGTSGVFLAKLKCDGGWLVADFDISACCLPVVRGTLRRLSNHFVYRLVPGAIETFGTPSNHHGKVVI